MYFNKTLVYCDNIYLSRQQSNILKLLGNKEITMKELCKLKKNELAINFKKIIEITSKPEYICTKCARVANEKKYLCEPTKMKGKKDS
jgi:hypothetical protein